MLNEDGSSCTPLAVLDFVVYESPQRSARRRPNEKGQRGIRSGPNASGAMARKLRSPKLMPPAVRRASLRGILIFLQNQEQIEYPAPMNTGACLGCRVMGYQAWEIAYGIC